MTSNRLTAKQREEFVAFCKNATDAQVENIYRKELDARRGDCAAIAREELQRRGLR